MLLHNVDMSSSISSLAPVDHDHVTRMLIIDDDRDIISLCHQALQPADVVVQSIHASDEVLTCIEQRLFDIVLIGMHTSTHQSLALLERIRQQAIDIPIVAIIDGTNTQHYDMFKHIAQSVKLGIQGVLFTPLCPVELHTTITDSINKHNRDTNTRWTMIQQLIQTEKLASLGRLVNAIGHEMNNPLQALYNSLQLLNKPSLTSKKRRQYQVLAKQEVEHLITIVQRILDFSRPSLDGMRPINLNTILEGVLRVVDKQVRTSKVQVLRDWCPRLPMVFAVGNRLKQVCQNLITNALEAMPNGGKLSIRTYTLNGSEYQIQAGVALSAGGAAGHVIRGPSVVVEITDTGVGIAPGELPNVFEPFYTTRFEATGLGLAISYSIVEQHQGQLSVSSTEGQGTTVRMCLPAAP